MSGNGRSECPFCGTAILEAGEAPSCKGCGERRGCRSTTCPRCGYHVPEESPLVGRLRRFFRRRPNGVHENGSLRLSDLPRGREMEVVALDLSDLVRLQKILALGIVPGDSIQVARRFPTLVVETGLTRFALDREVAAAILVRPRA